jgi:hypothetical protein
MSATEKEPVAFKTNGNSFASASALRAAHSDLLKRERTAQDIPVFLHEVSDFVQRGRTTGALIDSDNERSASQSMLDYWATLLYEKTSDLPNTTLDVFNPLLAPKLDDALCPYRGLDAFHESDQHVFFGRRRWIEDWVQRLAKQRLLPILGASGSGKSSLVLGGLVPALKNGVLPGSETWRYLPSLVPGSHPLANLARLLLPAGVASEEWIHQQDTLFRQSPRHLAHLLSATDNVPVVLVVDQFEEVFTLCDDDVARRAFLGNLLMLARVAGPRHTVILTMRTDYENRVARIPALQLLFDSAAVRVTSLNASEIRDAIIQPADLVGLKFEDGVVERLINDIIDEPAALPLLQFTLLKLWEDRDRNRVTMAAYRRLGGGRLALSHSADTFYAGLIPEEQITARRILLRMVRPSEGLEITSNRIRRDDLFSLGEARDRVERVLGKLKKARLVRLTESDNPEDTQVEVAHEALVRNWHQLVDWLEDERENLRERQRLTVAAEQWKKFDKDIGALWRGSVLEQALRLNYKDLTKDEKAFLRASLIAKELAEQEKERIKSERERQVRRQQQLLEARALLAEQDLRVKAEQDRAEAERERAEVQTASARRLRVFLIALAIASFLAVVSLVAALQLQLSIFALQDNIQTLNKTAIAAKATGDAAQDTVATTATFQEMLAAQASSLQTTSTAAVLANATNQAQQHIAEQQVAKAQATSTAASIAQATIEADQSKSLTQVAEAQATSTAAVIAQATTEANQANSLTQVAEAQATRIGLVSIINATSQAANATSQALQITATAQAVAAQAPVQTAVAAQATADAAQAKAGQVLDEQATTIAEQRKTEARILILKAQATTDPQIALLLAIEAANRSDDEDIFDFLQEAIQRANTQPIRHGTTTTSASWSPDSQSLLTTGNNKIAIIWDVDTARQKLTLRGHDGLVTSAVWSSDGDHIVTTSNDGTARIWDANSGKMLLTLNRSSVKLISAAWSPDDTRIATTSDDQQVQVWDASMGSLILAFSGNGERLTRAAWSPDGQRFVTASSDRAARIWDASRGIELVKINGHTDDVQSAAWSSNGHYIVTASSDSTARIWDVSTDQKILTTPAQTLSGHTGGVNNAMWSQSGNSVATGGDDMTVRTWNSATGEQRAVFRVNIAAIETTVWSPDTRWIAAGANDGTIRIFSLLPKDALKIARNLTTRSLTPDELNQALRGK